MNTTPATTAAINTSPSALPSQSQSRAVALALASVMTVAMLLGVNGLATSEATPAQLAHHQVQPQAQQPG